MNSSLLLLTSRVVACLAYYAAFLFGYWLAWTDFKPKHLRGKQSNDSTGEDAQVGASISEPAIRRSPLSDSQLGLASLNDMTLTSTEQRRLRLAEMMRQYTEQRPDEAAHAIRSWLRDD